MHSRPYFKILSHSRHYCDLISWWMWFRCNNNNIEEISSLEDEKYVSEENKSIFINTEFLKLFHEIYIKFYKKNQIIKSLNQESHIIESHKFRINTLSEFHEKILKYNIFISQCLLTFILYLILLNILIDIFLSTLYKKDLKRWKNNPFNRVSEELRMVFMDKCLLPVSLNRGVTLLGIEGVCGV